MNNAQRTRIGNYLGLARKAGLIAAGDGPAAAALKEQRACLLVLAEDAAPTVRQELLGMVGNIPVLSWPDKADLGRLVGKSPRGALALLDAGFAAAIQKVLEQEPVQAVKAR